MSFLFLLAAGLALFTSLLHAIGGEKEIVRPLRAGADPLRFAVFDVVWHMITWHLALMALALLVLAFRPDPLIGAALLAHFLGYTALFITISIRRFKRWLALPQWTLFLALSVLTGAGLRPWNGGPGLGAAAAIVGAAMLAAIGVLHAYWVVGGQWPGHDRASLQEMVVGGTGNGRFPGRAATLFVAGALLVSAALVLSVGGWLAVPALPPSLVRAGAWGLTGVLLLRGLGGFFEVYLRPSIVGTPYARWSRVLYSPLCVGLSGLVALALITG